MHGACACMHKLIITKATMRLSVVIVALLPSVAAFEPAASSNSRVITASSPPRAEASAAPYEFLVGLLGGLQHSPRKYEV